MKFEKVDFTNSLDQKLVGRVDLPLTGVPKAYALYAHCFTCTKTFVRSVAFLRR